MNLIQSSKQDQVSSGTALTDRQVEALAALKGAFDQQTHKMQKSGLPDWAMLEMAKHFGLIQSDFQSFRHIEGLSLFAKGHLWNDIIDRLDSQFPGWRGFVVHYRNGGRG